MWLAFGMTWGIGGLALLAGAHRPGAASPARALHYVAAFGPSLAGLIMVAHAEGRAGLRVTAEVACAACIVAGGGLARRKTPTDDMNAGS